jgi:hypothetical protein
MRRMRFTCCARAASGHPMADPAIPLTKSRRRIASPQGAPKSNTMQSARSNRRLTAPTRNSSAPATASTPAYELAFRSMRASRPRTERFAPISSAVGNTPATTTRRSAFLAPQSRRPEGRPFPVRRRTATITSTLPALSSSTRASGSLARPRRLPSPTHRPGERRPRAGR